MSSKISKPALLLDPRMDNWSQGTFTLSVSRLYRRAVAIASEPVPASFQFLIQVV